MKKRLSFYLFQLLFCGVIFPVLLAGCASKTDGGVNTLHRGDISGLKKIAVVPFRAIVSDDPAIRFVRCPVCGTTFRTCGFEGNPEKKIEEIFLKGIESSEQYSLIPSGYVDGVYKRGSAASFGKSPTVILTEVGKEVGADGIIAGYLFYYMERKGFGYSVAEPASVAFCMHLIRVKDGVSIWKDVFDKTQSSLMENIFNILPFIKSGGKWVTAEELSREGIKEILKDFPGLKGD
ncbi:MAG: hypothetical protein JRD43_03060 [Deltaproteobacteria bacterium]|nr:hypothetical protein [Deltaproteobacteria bacterium]MBW2595506.1 hypothetical protein [Deltaproteobacteria bacterium]MBW2649677.1 hypothetical protein [Deltaproteobacteria bacterium]